MSTPLLVGGKLKTNENEMVKCLVNTFPGTEQTIAAGSIGMGENEASHIDLDRGKRNGLACHLTTERTKREGLNDTLKKPAPRRNGLRRGFARSRATGNLRLFTRLDRVSSYEVFGRSGVSCSMLGARFKGSGFASRLRGSRLRGWEGAAQGIEIRSNIAFTRTAVVLNAMF